MAEILIVDDDPVVREYLSVMAGLEGHQCAVAEHGAEAIERLSNRSYDLAIIDIFMPVKEGIETILEMRGRRLSPRIVAMSAGCRFMSGGQALNFALALGADEVLPKPFSLDEFRTVLRRALNPTAERDRGEKSGFILAPNPDD